MDKEKFLQDFKRKFDNVLIKRPIRAEVHIIEPEVYIKVLGREDIIKFKFNYLESVKKNIHDLIELLTETFPIVTKTTIYEEDLPMEEVERLVAKNIYSLDEALLKKKSISETEDFRITKVIINRDEVFVQSLDTGKIFRYYFHMPISVYLKRYREYLWTSEQAGDIFFEKAEFIEEIFPEEEWETMQRIGGV